MKHIIYNKVLSIKLTPAAKIIYSSMIYNSMTANGIGEYIDGSGVMSIEAIEELINDANGTLIVDDNVIDPEYWTYAGIDKATYGKALRELQKADLLTVLPDEMNLHVMPDIVSSGYFECLPTRMSIAENITYSYMVNTVKFTYGKWMSGRAKLAELTFNSLPNINKHLTEMKHAGLVINDKYNNVIRIKF